MLASTSRNAKELVPPAVQANKEHQYALKVYTERLETELEHLDKLLASAEVSDVDEDETTNAGGNVLIPGATKPRSIIPLNDLVAESSPFYNDALRRQRYEDLTVVHPMKAQELEALADAVRSENYRVYALQAQAQSLQFYAGLAEPPPGFINTNKHGIDWDRVAQKVSSAGPSVQRTAKECEIRWLGDRHPQFNDAQWTQAEVAKVRELVDGAREGEVDWCEIAEKLETGRTPVDCMRHAISRKTHSWTPDADKRLLEAVHIYGTDSWALVARWVSEDATASQCQNRYLRTLDPTLRRGPWTPDEDERVKQAVAVCGHVWVDVAAYVEGRNNEQCRDRYQEYLNPAVAKGKWTEEQDAALLKAVEQVGMGKWKEVSQVLNVGRTDNMCRMRYGILTRPKKPGKITSPVPSEGLVTAKAKGASKAPSRARTKQPSGQSTPANESTPACEDQPQFLILHPESYVAPSSSATPGPSANPKPKPRPRKKKTPTTTETAATAPPEQQAGPSTPAPASNDTSNAGAPTSSEDSALATHKRLRAAVDGPDPQPSKRRRVAKSPLEATSSGSPFEDATPTKQLFRGRALQKQLYRPHRHNIRPLLRCPCLSLPRKKSRGRAKMKTHSSNPPPKDEEEGAVEGGVEAPEVAPGHEGVVVVHEYDNYGRKDPAVNVLAKALYEALGIRAVHGVR
ncbi:snRNA-activating protein complex subunit 4 [Trametes pubescens]|uniref:snRNA-activating protein complex subunit 4 n=1 Tax=Trametes pubescens TaxID=154538 RepID=A0A1M2VSD3_TRAPU|nr:snRNA-activating protein complex subunit 4 [Trametes pubescens]